MRLRFTLLASLCFVVSLGSLVSCGKGVDGAKYDHGEFQKYFDSFETYSEQEGKNVSAALGTIEINFEEIGTDEVGGECKKNFMGHAKIVIEADSWKKMSEESREVLILHELGHCVLNRQHREETTTSDGVNYPVSLMYHQSLDGEIYLQFQKKYLEELFRN